MTITWPEAMVDPHIHQWNPFVTRRHSWAAARILRFVPKVPRAIGRLAPQYDREFIGEPQVALKPYLPADYAADTGGLPIGHVVHVEAEWPKRRHHDAVAETEWVTSLPFGEPGRPKLGGIVVWADPRQPTIASVLDAHLAASHLVRGVRICAAHHPDKGVKDFADDDAMLSSPDFLRGFAAIAERGLSFEIWCYSHQLPHALELVAEYPETTFVLNHYSTPVGAFGPRGRRTARSAAEVHRMMGQWREDVAAIAEHDNVVAKHSGLGMPLLGDVPKTPRGAADIGQITDRAAPMIRHLHDSFGSDRTMWASNYPIDKPGLALPATIGIILDVLGTDAEPEKLLGGVARRTYRIE